MNYAASVRSSVGLLHNGQSWSTLTHKEVKPTPPSEQLAHASIVAFIGAVFFVIAFTSPYWLQSYEYTYSSFLNMGLWEFCFTRYRHFDFQYDKMYDGCNHVFSYEYQQIREWLLPAWLMATQAFMSIALVCVATCLITLSLVLMRMPLKGIMRHEWRLIGFCALLQAVTVLSIFLAVAIFGGMCWSRSWLLNPNFNYLSWSYIFANISGLCFLMSGLMLFKETYVSRMRKQENVSLVQLEPSIHSMPVPLSQVSSQGYI